MSCSENKVRKRVILNPESPFSGVIDSIKLYAAMIRAYSELYGETEEIISSLRKGCIKVSSPMLVENNEYYVFKPILPLTKEEKIDTVSFKKFKKMSYLPLDIAMEALREGRYTKHVVYEAIRGKPECVETVEKPGVTVNRESMKSTIYYKDTLEIKNMCQMWVDIEASDNWMDMAISLLRYLGDMGLSKRRSGGYGHFTLEVKDSYSSENSLNMLISKYIPTESEIKSQPFNEFRYGITSVEGYSRDGRVFGVLRAFTEGTTFPKYIELKGRVVDYGSYAVVGVPLWI